MENNAFITLTTVQYTKGTEEDVMELTTRGKYKERNGKFYIVYEESEVTGFEDTTTTIKVAPEKILLSRKGKFNSKMEFAPGEKKLCKYQTPYGEIAVAVNPLKYENKLDKNGGSVKLEYILDMNNTMYAKNKLELNVRVLN